MNLATWIKTNTPETALIGALLSLLGGYLGGAVTLHDAIVGAGTALTTFALVESHSDAIAPK